VEYILLSQTKMMTNLLERVPSLIERSQMVDVETSPPEFDGFADIYDDEGDLIEHYLDDDGAKRILSVVWDEVQIDEPWYRRASRELEDSREIIELDVWLQDLELERLIKESEGRIGSYPPLLRYVAYRYGGVIPWGGRPFLASDRAYSRDWGTYLGGLVGYGVWRGSP